MAAGPDSSGRFPWEMASKHNKNLLQKTEIKMTKIDEQKEAFGTREFSEVSYNIGIGCSNNCRYCFAAHYAVQHKDIPEREAWQVPRINIDKAVQIPPKYDGLVMFPTRHDFYLRLKGAYLGAIVRLLDAGNDVLVTTKARLRMIEYLCANLDGYKGRVKFMITITSLNEDICDFWEPNAPSPIERLAALKHAHDAGFETSVLVEPLLDGCGGALALYDAVEPHVTGEIWFGLIQFARERVDITDPENVKALERLSRLQSFDNIRFLHSQLDGRDKVRWKKSIRGMISKPEPEDIISFVGEIK
jgi:DNA repair photolyase